MWKSLAVVLVSTLALTSCSSDAPIRSEERDGFMGVLLPRPFGSVAMDKDPIACSIGWVGIVTGGFLGGAIGSGSGSLDDNPQFSEAGAAAGFVIGGFVGGLLLTPVGHLFQWFWDLLSGEDAEIDYGGYSP